MIIIFLTQQILSFSYIIGKIHLTELSIKSESSDISETEKFIIHIIMKNQKENLPRNLFELLIYPINN